MKLENLTEFLNYLNPNKKDFEKCNTAIESLDIHKVNIKDYTFWGEDSFTRNLVSKTEGYEVFVCCWKPGQSSAFHDLMGQWGWVKIISGELDFLKLKKPKQENQTKIRLKKGGIFSPIQQEEMYAIENNSGRNAVSLHLISLPTSFYNAKNGNGTDVDLIKRNFYSINGTIINI